MNNSLPRYVEKKLRSVVSKDKVRLIFGARQTGKSTLLRRINPGNALFINLQDRRQRLRFEKEPDELIKMLRAEKKTRTVLIDEIQKVPALLDDIQLLYDETPEKFKFILTGSSARKLRSSAANLLPGRAHQYHLCPLILQERQDAKKPFILDAKDNKSFQSSFKSADIEIILIYGNLPGIVMEKEAVRKITLESYTEIYLEEEIRREALVRNVGPFTKFLELAALEAGQIVNLSNISQESGVPVSTLRSFYQIITDTFIGFWLQPFIGQSRKRLLTTPMFYFFDLGVRNALARIPLTRQSLSIQAGTLFQQWVVTELWNRCTYLGRNYRLFFWRTVSGAEIDVVLETPTEIIPIEVKWTESPREKDARHLRSFLNTYSKRAKRGFIICRCPYKLGITKNITAIPWYEI